MRFKARMEGYHARATFGGFSSRVIRDGNPAIRQQIASKPLQPSLSMAAGELAGAAAQHMAGISETRFLAVSVAGLTFVSKVGYVFISEFPYEK